MTRRILISGAFLVTLAACGSPDTTFDFGLDAGPLEKILKTSAKTQLALKPKPSVTVNYAVCVNDGCATLFVLAGLSPLGQSYF